MNTSNSVCVAYNDGKAHRAIEFAALQSGGLRIHFSTRWNEPASQAGEVTRSQVSMSKETAELFLNSLADALESVNFWKGRERPDGFVRPAPDNTIE